MRQAVRWIWVAIFAMAAIAIYTGAAPAAETEAGPDTVRFEVTSIKAVRPILVSALSAIRQGDVARAKEIFDSYDSAWNGIEVYINVSDTRHEMATDAVTVTANSRNRRPMIPPRRRIGMNTAISEKLIDNTVKPISREPLSAALNGGSPFSMCR